MESLRIAILSALPPGASNGAAEYTSRLVSALGARHEVEIVTPFERIVAAGIRTEGPKEALLTSAGEGPLVTAIKFNLALRRESFDRFDVVWGVSYNGFASKLPSPRTALVTNLLGVIADEWLQNLAQLHVGEIGMLAGMPPFALAEAWSARRSNRVVAISRYAARRATDLYGIPPSKISTIPAFLDAANVTVSFPRARANVPTALFVGRMRSRKRVDLVLRAWRIVVGVMPRAKLILVGSGELLGAYRTLARRLLPEDSYAFLGNVSREELWRLYESAWVLCAPSEQEGFGLVSIEAQLFGTPVVVSRLGGLPETLVPDKTGFVVREQTPEAYGRALLRLLSDEALSNELGREGHFFAKASFTTSSVTPLLESVLLGVLVAGPPGARTGEPRD